MQRHATIISKKLDKIFALKRPIFQWVSDFLIFDFQQLTVKLPITSQARSVARHNEDRFTPSISFFSIFTDTGQLTRSCKPASTIIRILINDPSF